MWFSSDSEHNEDEPPKFSQNKPYDLNSKIMLAAIVSLSFVVVFVLFLHIYAKCFLRRQARRRSVDRSFDLFNNNHVIHHSTERPRTGLEPAVIGALPIFVFSQTDGHGGECAVCLSNLENGEMARVLPNCKHTFHAECIDKWLGSQSTCPICRTEAEPRRLQPEPREGPRPAASVGAPTAPPLVYAEGTSNNNNSNRVEASAKVIITGSSASSSRLNSFRRMLGGGERSSRRLHDQDEIV